MTGRFVKLALYQSKESLQEIIFVSQAVQRVEVLALSIDRKQDDKLVSL